ncbi:MAG: hypothetical protein ACRCV0_01410 [Brevinema sp.]
MYKRYIYFLCALFFMSCAHIQDTEQAGQRRNGGSPVVSQNNTIDEAVKQFLKEREHFFRGRNKYLVKKAADYLSVDEKTENVWVRESSINPNIHPTNKNKRIRKNPYLNIEVLKVDNNFGQASLVRYTNLHTKMEFSGYGKRQESEELIYTWLDGTFTKVRNTALTGFMLYKENISNKYEAVNSWGWASIKNPESRLWFIKQDDQNRILIMIKATQNKDNNISLHMQHIHIYMRLADINSAFIKTKSDIEFTTDPQTQEDFTYYVDRYKETIVFKEGQNNFSNILLQDKYVPRRSEVDYILRKVRWNASVYHKAENGFNGMYITKGRKKGVMSYMSDPNENDQVYEVKVDVFQDDFTKPIPHSGNSIENLLTTNPAFDLHECIRYDKQEIKQPKLLFKKGHKYVDITESLGSSSLKYYQTRSMWELRPKQNYIKRPHWRRWQQAYDKTTKYIYTIRERKGNKWIQHYIKIWNAEKITTSSGEEYYLITQKIPNMLGASTPNTEALKNNGSHFGVLMQRHNDH